MGSGSAFSFMGFLLWDDRPARLAAFAITASIFCSYAVQFSAPPIVCCDADNYWNLGKLFFTDGHFSLWTFPTDLRGYLWPLILGAIQSVAENVGLNPFRVLFLINGLFFAFNLCVVVPQLVVFFGGRSPRTWQILAFAGLFLGFWRGFLLYPLTDVASLFFLTTGIWLVSIAFWTVRRGAAIAAAFAAGIAFGGASNIRPIYLITPLLLLLAIGFSRALQPKRKIAMAATTLLAMFLCYVPQSLINQRHLGTLSPTAHTQDLYRVQLFLGLLSQRTECAYYIDPVGRQILQSRGLELLTRAADNSYVYRMPFDLISYKTYFSMLLHHPLDFALLYTRHFLDGMMIFGSDIYACRPANPSLATIMLSAGLFLTGLVLMLIYRSRLSMIENPLFLLIPIIPALLTIPASIEGRFMLPLHLAAYGLIVFVMPDRIAFRHMIQSWRLGLGLGCVLALLALNQMSNLLASTYFYEGESPQGVRLRPGTVLINHAD